MATLRRPYTRATETVRREALIAAACDLVGEGGVRAATVRAVAARAGVTPGLIRHYFSSQDALLQAAYLSVIEAMLERSAALVAAAPPHPAARLAACITGWLRPPAMSPSALQIWTGFLPLTQTEATVREGHGRSGRGLRDLVADLVGAMPDGPAGRDAEALSTACAAVVKGLWIEGCLHPGTADTDRLARIGLDACGDILGLDLKGHLPES
jgi:AcrR family transcriptional regulator